MDTLSQPPLKPLLDPKTFQQPLSESADTIALKVGREGRQQIPVPAFVTGHIFLLIRPALYTYDLFFFLNADERRQKVTEYRVAYRAVTLPLIRCMIDSLYSITVILTNPGLMSYQFRASGYRKMLEVLMSTRSDTEGTQGGMNGSVRLLGRNSGTTGLMRPRFAQRKHGRR